MRSSKTQVGSAILSLCLVVGAGAVTLPPMAGAAGQPDVDGAVMAAQRARAAHDKATEKSERAKITLKKARKDRKAAAKAVERADATLVQAEFAVEVAQANAAISSAAVETATRHRAEIQVEESMLTATAEATGAATGDADSSLVATAGSVLISGLTAVVGPVLSLVAPVDDAVDAKLDEVRREGRRADVHERNARTVASAASRAEQSAAEHLEQVRRATTTARSGLKAVKREIAYAAEVRTKAVTRERKTKAAEAEAVATEEAAKEAEATRRARERAAASPSRSDSAAGRFVRPGTGATTSPYGMRTHPITGAYKLHSGLDFAYGNGNAYAAASGRVSEVTYDSAYGNLVTIDHGGGLQTRYAHLSGVTVGRGQQVSAGQIVGRIGSTGYATGPHLHFEVLVNGEFRNPADYLG